MATVWLLLRADLRQRWRALLGLALILGLVGGVVLTAAAGARRTETAYPRLLTWANAAQVDIIPEGTGMTPAGTASSGFYADLRKLPQVATMDTGALYEMVVPGSVSSAPGDNQGIPVQAWASPDGTMGVTADRVKVLSGALFNPAAPGQAMVDQRLAALEHLKPGGTLRLTGVINGGNGVRAPHRDLALTFTVTAIVAFDTAIVPSGQHGTEPTVLLSSPFTRIAPAGLSYGDQAAVRLRPGASTAPAFLKAANTLARKYAGTKAHPGTGGQLNVVSLDDQVAATNRAIRPEAIALAAFAGLAGLIALAVLGQLLSRQLAMDAVEYPVLRAVGATRLPLLALSLARLAVVTVGGAVTAVAIAIAASPLMPIGPARLAEPAPGPEVNLAILAAGAAVIALAPLAALVPAAWRWAGQAGGPLGVAEPGQAGTPARTSRLGAALGRAGSLTGSVGVRMAFEPGRGRTAVPVRSALAGSAIATAALAAAAVFGASLITLVATPHAYGQNWDQVVDLGFGNVPGALGAEIAAKVPVAQYAAGSYGQLTVNHQSVAAIGLDPLRGGGYLTLLAGRAPRSSGEIALGAATMLSLGVRLGDSVAVDVHLVTGGTDTSHVMRVVGEVVLPAFSRGTFAPTGLGTGAVVTDAVVSAPGDSDTGCSGKQTCYNFFLLRYRPGADVTAAGQDIMTALAASGCPIGSCTANVDERPDGIKSYAAIRDTPFVLGALLAVLAVGTFAHVLLTGVRRRSRDLALLKTLGFTRAQVLRVVAWQATTFATVALLIGVPLGVVVGDWAWAAFARSIGVAPQSTVPLWLILLAVAVTLVLANAVAAFPGVAAARLRPAAALRAE